MAANDAATAATLEELGGKISFRAYQVWLNGAEEIRGVEEGVCRSEVQQLLCAPLSREAGLPPQWVLGVC
jgi:hypothetical protein